MIQYKKPTVILLHSTPLYIAEIAGRSCYNSFTLSENPCVREFPNTLTIPEHDVASSDLVDKLANVHFHLSVLEHINLSFYIQNVSREIIIELNRHRIGIATSQMSTRYTIEKLVDYFLELYGVVPVESPSFNRESNFYKLIKQSIVHDSTEMIDYTVDYMFKMLRQYHLQKPLVSGLTGGAKKKQNDYVKRMLPESWMMSGVWTFNLRALQHLFELRLSGAAYPFIRELTASIADVVPHKYRAIIDKKYRSTIDELKS